MDVEDEPTGMYSRRVSEEILQSISKYGRWIGPLFVTIPFLNSFLSSYVQAICCK
jgi:hypothetical protein